MSLPSLTNEEMLALAGVVCQHCGAGIAVRYRGDSREFVHDRVLTKTGIRDGHTLCAANGLRKQYAE